MMRASPIRRQRGFSLIEALVAFLILSVGMLGIGSLQMLSLRSGTTASLRSLAVIKAIEISERMRANPTALINYASGVGDAGTDNGCNDLGGAIKRCTPGELAADDVFNWKTDLKSALPNNAGTTASIVVTPPGANDVLTTVDITINWNERDLDKQAQVAQQYTLSTSLCGALEC
jgi:type IV pilus assembly protein PilV